jgi:DNA polymerase-3 subunit delta'
VKLSEVVGHERARQILSRALARDRLPPALLFSGPDGVGKKALALATAQAALCERAPVPEPCGECGTCRRISAALEPGALEGRREEADRHPSDDGWRNFRLHPDLVLVEGWRLTKTGRPRPEPEIRVGQVRELVADVPGAPFEARRRVFIVDDAHGMNESSQNALLKSLEEPPPRSHLMLVSSRPLGLRQTIRSRCQVLRFGPLGREAIATLLSERRDLSQDEARLRAALAGGSLGAALAFESESYRSLREGLLSLLEGVGGLDALGRMRAAEDLEQAEDASLLLTTLRSLLRDLAALRSGAVGQSLLNGDVADRLEPLAAGPLGARAGDLAGRVGRTRAALGGFANKLLALDVLMDHLSVK